MQLPAVRAARRLGVMIHLADGNAECLARSEVDNFFHIDLRDVEALLESARGIPRLKAVFTAGTDFSSSVAYVAENLGLPGIAYETSLRATDKGLMRRALGEAGVPVPRFVTVHSARSDEIDRIVSGLDPPFVVKPVDNMGARGVRRVEASEDLGPAIGDALRFSRTGAVIVEEMIGGIEYSLDAIVIGEEIRVTGIGERHIFFPPYFVELGHTIPARLDDNARTELERVFGDAIRAIGITRGAAKGDVFLQQRSGTYRAVIGEIAARLSGGFMSGWTYPAATGVPLTELGLRVALGDTPDRTAFIPTRDLITAERALISAPGVVREVTVAGSVYRRPELVELFVHCVAGDTVGPPSNNVEKIANAIAVAPQRERAERVALEALDAVVARLETGNEDTDGFLFIDGWNGPFARFGGKEIVQRVATMSPANGDPESFRTAVKRGGALSVRRVDDLPVASLYLGLDAAELLQKLVDGAMISLVDAEEHTGPVLEALFWRPFLAAGGQGVRYLIDLIHDGLLPEVAALIGREER